LKILDRPNLDLQYWSGEALDENCFMLPSRSSTFKSDVATALSSGKLLRFIIWQNDFTTEMLFLSQHPEFFKQMNFSVVIRKDWNYIETLKSLPQFIFERTTLEFPPSLSPTDPFFSETERQGVISEISHQLGEIKNPFVVVSEGPPKNVTGKKLLAKVRLLSMNAFATYRFLLSTSPRVFLHGHLRFFGLFIFEILFELFYPVRKTYYFLNYQYQTRIVKKSTLKSKQKRDVT
jgi:hypothetical protein